MKQINEEKSVYIDEEGFKEKIIEAHNKIIEENPATLIISDVLTHFGALIAGELFGYVEEDDAEFRRKAKELCTEYGVELRFCDDEIGGGLFLTCFEEHEGEKWYYRKHIERMVYDCEGNKKKLDYIEDALTDFVLEAKRYFVWKLEKKEESEE